MASSKPISHPTREKSASSTTTTTAGRRSPRPSSSPVRHQPEKATTAPHHLKPKPTPSTTNAAAKSSPSTAAAKRQPIKKPMEKTPSPSPRPGRTLSSTPASTRTTRERSPKPPSPSPMPRAYYQRTSLIPLMKGQTTLVVDKSSSASDAKTVKTAKPGVYTRSKSPEKREVIATPSAFVTTSSASDSLATIAKAELINAAKDGENELLAHVYVNNSPKNPEEEEQEHGGVVSPVHEQQKEVNIDDIVVDPDQQHEKQSESLVAENEEVDEEEGGEEDENEHLAHFYFNISPKTPEEEEHVDGGIVSPVHGQQKEVHIDDIVVDHDQQHDEKQSKTLIAENEEIREDEEGKEENKKQKAKEEVKKERVKAMHKRPRKPMTEPAAQDVRPAEAASLRGVAAAAKKEAQRSNDVIEEAKSKFLEKRKNKVLALVGAFETVMAMQEPEVQQVQPQVKGKEAEEEVTTPTTTNEPTEPIDNTGLPEPTEVTESKESTEESTEVTE